MEEHPSYHVYKHIPEFANYRGYKFTGPLLVRNEFLTKLFKIGYYIIKLQHKTIEDHFMIVSILPNSGNYAKKSNDLSVLIVMMEKQIKKEETIDSVIVIVPEEIYRKKNITKKVETFNSNKDGRVPVAKHYDIYPYKNFYLNILKHKSMGLYKILSESEAEEVIEYHRKNKTDFPIIYSDNAPIVWLGAYPGDFLELTRWTPSSGKEVKYELVKKRS